MSSSIINYQHSYCFVTKLTNIKNYTFYQTRLIFTYRFAFQIYSLFAEFFAAVDCCFPVSCNNKLYTSGGHLHEGGQSFLPIRASIVTMAKNYTNPTFWRFFCSQKWTSPKGFLFSNRCRTKKLYPHVFN